MKEIKGNIWDYHDLGFTICIPTNGYVKKNGCAVMGGGLALQANRRYPGFSKKLGALIGHPTTTLCRNVWETVWEVHERVLVFPVKRDFGDFVEGNVVLHMAKRFEIGDLVPGWALKAELSIISESLKKLDTFRKDRKRDVVVIPRVGCGAGELDWETQVKPLCFEYGDWLCVVSL